jgi:ATP-dependent HslUV protease ATP-binding subunit HslU
LNAFHAKKAPQPKNKDIPMSDRLNATLPIAIGTRVPGLTPRQIVEELDKYIIGQDNAKKAVAIALRNRSRRRLLDQEMQEDVYPKNIIMIGPTGVGKTEIARRLARLEDAPFVKVEASKFTEVGYVGRDVESIIRDLIEISINQQRSGQMEGCKDLAEKATEERILDLLLPNNLPRYQPSTTLPPESEPSQQEQSMETTRARFREMLREGKLESKEIEPEVKEAAGNVMVGMPAGAGLEEMGIDIKDMIDKMMPSRKRRKKMKVSEARPLLYQEEMDRLLDMDKIVKIAIDRVEQSGIVFLDEIDKIVGRGGGSGPDVSRAGVQRDILPLVEGSTVFTKYGMVKTDHVLFIAAGAFHGTSPSDLIPELQGRFPIRVELKDLGENDFKRILTEPKNSLIHQYAALLSTEGVNLEFTDSGVQEMARMAATINKETENIGARRLHTILETILEEISFAAPDKVGEKLVIDVAYVKEKLDAIIADSDLSKYIL